MMPDPTKIGKYEILEKIGRGGMGHVYRALDPLLKREVALKTMLKELSADEELRARFTREAQSAGGLRHPNIVTIYDLGEDTDRCPYIAMEFLTGTDLEHIIKNKIDLPLLKKLDIIIQTCRGLGYAHSKGIIHRDIKPANIRLLDNGEVKIMDFGIAKIAASQFTRTGMIMGTPHYMAPEQIRGEKINGRADIFSLGVVLYESLVFRKPFAGENPTAVLFKIIHSDPDQLVTSSFTPPPGLEEIVLRSLSKKPETRYQKCEEFAAELENVFDQTKETAGVDATLVSDKPYATITITRTSLPQRSVSGPQKTSTPARQTPPPVQPTPAPAIQRSATPQPVAATTKATEVPTPRAAPVREKTAPVRDLPPITPTPVPGETTKWLLLASSGLLGIALIGTLLFGIIRKINAPPTTNAQSPMVTKPAPAHVVPQKKEMSIPPAQVKPAQEPPKAIEAPPTVVQAPPAPPPTGYVSVNVQPWAEIKEIKDAKGNALEISPTVTPCRLKLPAGKYEISLYNSQFQTSVLQVEVQPDETTLINKRMDGFDYAKAIDALGL